jgi:hypothetical protein
MDCSLLPIVNYPVASGRYTPGREMLPTIRGIVLIDLTLSAEQYLLTTQCGVERDFPLGYPKSVHYVVTANGAVQNLVNVQNTAWGLDEYYNVNVPTIPTTQDPSTPWVFLGLENTDGGGCNISTDQLDSLVDLICCICREFNLAPTDETILTAYDLNSHLDTLTFLPITLIGLVQSCMENAGSSPTLTNGQLQQILDNLQACCDTHTSSIQELFVRLMAVEQTLPALSASVASLTNRVTSLEADWALYLPMIGGLSAQLQSLQALYLNMKACTDAMCPATTTGVASIHYTIPAGMGQTITPNVPVWINFPTKISDTIPNSVLPGPLWSANLTESCIHQIDVIVRLDSSSWCAGKKARLILVACGSTVVLNEQILPGGGSTVTLFGSTVVTVPPACPDVHVMVWTDDITTPAKVVSSGDIQIRC